MPKYVFALSETPSGFAEYTLENGLRVFILEDFSSAPIRVEYASIAGFNCQTPKTAGFFQLYTKLFSEAGKLQEENIDVWYPSLSSVALEYDASRYVLQVAPSQLEDYLRQLSYCAFVPVFSDDNIASQFSALKKEVLNYSSSTTGFINSSIDARLYSDAPWKQDTGVYPALFSNTTIAEVRSILMNIARTYYVPKNSALFISGGIKKEAAFSLVKKYFSHQQQLVTQNSNNDRQQESKVAKNNNTKRKFVLSDKEFSSDLTQIVMQYTNTYFTQADIASYMFNARASSFKTNTLSNKELGILGEEYINVASIHKGSSSQIVFQSILDKSKNITPVEQVTTFIDCVKSAADNLQFEEVTNARQTLLANYKTILGNSTELMNILSKAWATSYSLQNKTDDLLISNVFAREDEIVNFNLREMQMSYNSETPFVFVLVNNSVYKKYQKDFTESGYELITKENGSWYTQELYKTISNDDGEKKDEEEVIVINSEADYIEKNLSQFNSFSLANGIPVIYKKSDNTNSSLIMISINGGNLSSVNNPGFISVIINALADNIYKEINTQRKNGAIDGNPIIRSQTDLSSSYISIESLSNDMSVIISCISRALIYGDIYPAQADGLVYDARSKKRLYNGSVSNQLYSKGISELFKGSDYPKIFDSENDILTDVNYNEIAMAYPTLLDASLYSVIVTGKIDEASLTSSLESYLGVLSSQTQRVKKQTVILPKFTKDKRVTANLRHLFLTDISKEEAGPQPKELIPTTNFYDPVQYWLPSPKPNSTDFTVFNLLLYTLKERLQKSASAISKDINVNITFPTNIIRAAVITFTNVERTNQIDKLYQDEILKLNNECLNDELFSKLINEMKNNFVLTSLSNTQTNRGTALLIRSGIERGAYVDAKANAASYIYDYQIANKLQQYNVSEICKRYFSNLAPLRIYSKDSKR